MTCIFTQTWPDRRPPMKANGLYQMVQRRGEAAGIPGAVRLDPRRTDTGLVFASRIGRELAGHPAA
jgi:hypothetical protein